MTPSAEDERSSSAVCPDETLYLRARDMEGLRLDVDAIRTLPYPPAGWPDGKVWMQRAVTSTWAITHLRERGARRVLDLGCGYGWLAARMAREAEVDLVAFEASAGELERARRAFGSIERIEWVCGDVFEEGWAPPAFDAIVLCASIQYFGDLGALFTRLTGLLNPGGEILVFDSPLWPRSEVAAARLRSDKYYASLGLTALAPAFHQHAREDLDRFGAFWYYLPDSWSARVRRRLLGLPVSSFPIVGIPSGEIAARP